MGHVELIDGMYRDGFNDPLSGLVMGETAEELARRYEIARDEQDEYALRSQQRAASAIATGRFAAEILPLELNSAAPNSLSPWERAGVRGEARAATTPHPNPLPKGEGKSNGVSFATDEHVRVKTTIEDLRKLPSVFAKDGTVTAGNSSGITDGAAAVVVMSEKAVQESDTEPLARIVDYEIVGVPPEIMGIGPVPATRTVRNARSFRLQTSI